MGDKRAGLLGVFGCSGCSERYEAREKVACYALICC